MAAAELKKSLLPPIPSTSSYSTAANVSSTRRLFFPGMDVIGLKKRGQGLRSWIRVDARTGISQSIELDKFTIMRRCDLPARDLRLLDPLFLYPSTILGRERAIVVNLEQIRCIITADEVLLLNSLDPYVMQYVKELGHLLSVNDRADAASFGDRVAPGCLPFELRALEAALEAACTYLDSQAEDIQGESYPFLDQLTSTISTKNLERVRGLKSRLVALTRRVQKVRDEIEQLMDDDGDMAEMFLTEKKIRLENSFNRDQPFPIYNSVGPRVSFSAPVTPVSSPPEPKKLNKTLSLAWSRHSNSTRSSESGAEKIDELEMLLEAYFVVIDNTLNKLTSLKEYIDDTEDFINIQLEPESLSRGRERRMAAMAAAAAAIVGSMSPFPFYYLLWNYPQAWVNLCGKGVDPSHRMAQISHAFKLLQFFSLLSVARISWPPWYCLVIFATGQYLNFKVYHLLGEAGTYYGVRFGKNVPWVSDFPFGYIKDPQYVGSILSLLACLSSVPYPYVLFWILGYLFMMHIESKEDPATRAKPLS